MTTEESTAPSVSTPEEFLSKLKLNKGYSRRPCLASVEKNGVARGGRESVISIKVTATTHTIRGEVRDRGETREPKPHDTASFVRERDIGISNNSCKKV